MGTLPSTGDDVIDIPLQRRFLHFHRSPSPLSSPLLPASLSLSLLSSAHQLFPQLVEVPDTSLVGVIDAPFVPFPPANPSNIPSPSQCGLYSTVDCGSILGRDAVGVLKLIPSPPPTICYPSLTVMTIMTSCRRPSQTRGSTSSCLLFSGLSGA